MSQATPAEEDVYDSIHIEVEENHEMTEAVSPSAANAGVRTIEIEITHCRSVKHWFDYCGFLRISNQLSPELLKEYIVHLSEENEVEILKEREILVSIEFDHTVTTDRVREIRRKARYARVGIDHMCVAIPKINLLCLFQPELATKLVVNLDAVFIGRNGKRQVVCYTKGRLIAANEDTRWPPGTMFLGHTMPEEAWQKVVRVPKKPRRGNEPNQLLDLIRHNAFLTLFGLASRAPEPAAPEDA